MPGGASTGAVCAAKRLTPVGAWRSGYGAHGRLIGPLLPWEIGPLLIGPLLHPAGVHEAAAIATEAAAAAAAAATPLLVATALADTAESAAEVTVYTARYGGC
jgi:hypothetical protein